VPKKTLGKVSVTVTWRRGGDFSLPSARQNVLGKEVVADVQFAERSLPSVTLGKAFAECLRHSAKKLCPAVIGPSWFGNIIVVFYKVLFKTIVFYTETQ
jgi:hypothetical protein